MKKALNAWSVNGNESFAEMFESLKTAGFAAVELNLDNVGHSAHSLTMETNYHLLNQNYHVRLYNYS